MAKASLILVKGLFDSGNAYGVLGKCYRGARKAGWTEAQWEAFKAEATAGDYDHLLQTVMAKFDEPEEAEPDWD